MAKKAKGNQNINSTVHPVIEAGISLVKILVLLTSGIVFIVSFMANAAWYDIVIRTSFAMIVVGLLGWYLNWMLGKWVLKYELRKFENEHQKNSDLI